MKTKGKSAGRIIHTPRVLYMEVLHWMGSSWYPRGSFVDGGVQAGSHGVHNGHRDAPQEVADDPDNHWSVQLTQINII